MTGAVTPSLPCRDPVPSDPVPADPVPTGDPIPTQVTPIVRLNCLGTVGYHPNDHRHTSCYFLPESGIVLDAGSGAFRLPDLVQTDTLDVLLSHAHLDHTFGLTFFLDLLHQIEKRRGRPLDRLTVHGEAAKLHAVKTHLFSDLLFPATLDAQWLAIDDRPSFLIGDVTVTWRPQIHPGGSVAYRLEWPAIGKSALRSVEKSTGKSLVYATDTIGDLSEEFISWSHSTDLLMHECYFRDDAAKWAMKTGHSWTSRVAEIAIRSKPKKLMLTHINPIDTDDDPAGIEFVRQRVDSEVCLAEDELAIEF